MFDSSKFFKLTGSNFHGKEERMPDIIISDGLFWGMVVVGILVVGILVFAARMR